jgi:hypothetical protein
MAMALTVRELLCNYDFIYVKGIKYAILNYLGMEVVLRLDIPD